MQTKKIPFLTLQINQQLYVETSQVLLVPQNIQNLFIFQYVIYFIDVYLFYLLPGIEGRTK
jgi:hypothetical protein